MLEVASKLAGRESRAAVLSSVRPSAVVLLVGSHFIHLTSTHPYFLVSCANRDSHSPSSRSGASSRRRPTHHAERRRRPSRRTRSRRAPGSPRRAFRAPMDNYRKLEKVGEGTVSLIWHLNAALANPSRITPRIPDARRPAEPRLTTSILLPQYGTVVSVFRGRSGCLRRDLGRGADASILSTQPRLGPSRLTPPRAPSPIRTCATRCVRPSIPARQYKCIQVSARRDLVPHARPPR